MNAGETEEEKNHRGNERNITTDHQFSLFLSLNLVLVLMTNSSGDRLEQRKLKPSLMLCGLLNIYDL